MRHVTTFAVTIAFLTLAASDAALACPGQMQVRAGDTLSAMAGRCGTSVGALLRANPGLEPRRLQPGTVIDVPTALPSPAAPSYGVRQVPVAPPIATPTPSYGLSTTLKGPVVRQRRDLYVDPAALPRLPGMPPLPGQPGYPGFPPR